jgi:ATP-dependent Clp endopeptidase proteolytic subunit ClpP
MKTKQYWNLKAVPGNNKEIDVFIYGIIGSSWWNDDGSDTTAFSFVPEFKDLESKYDRINIRINSPGGSIEEGLPVFNAIQQSKKNIHTYNDGIAYSMAAIILLAGKTVHAAKNSLTLLHSPMTFMGGNAKDMRQTANDLDIYENSLIQSVIDKTGLSTDQIKNKWFDYNDHLMTAQQALDDKLINIIEETEGNIPENISNLSFRQVMNIYHAFDHNEREGFINSLVNKMKAIFDLSSKKTENKENIHNTKTDIMFLNKAWIAIIALLKTDPEKAESTEMTSEMMQQVNDLITSLQTGLTEEQAARQKAVDDLAAEKVAHDLVKTELAALKAEDAGKESVAHTDIDKIKVTNETNMAHNKEADNFMGAPKETPKK